MKKIISLAFMLSIIGTLSFQVVKAQDTMPNEGITISLEQAPELVQTQSAEVNEEIDLSVDENGVRTSNEAGETLINISGIEDQSPQTLYMDSDLKASKSSFEDSQEITVYDGRIIGATDAIVETIGGYDSTGYIYSTIEDVQNKTNGVPINGAGYDGEYLGYENIDGQYYINVNIGGQIGYLSLNNVQVVPTSLVKANSYYESVDGEWVYNSAIDPLMSDEYETYVVGISPEWAEEGQKYYTEDDQNFTTEVTTNDNMRETAEVYTSSSYFQNLPFRSASNYTGADYKNYLAATSHTNAKYYNATDAFVEAQDSERVNSLLLFTLANHESAYGSSKFSNQCNNFFGRGAYDSNPGNACIEYGFNTPRDGILAEAMFLNNEFFDVTWYTYAGTHFGNKTSGINVYYASDPDWGLKNSSIAYATDSYLGNQEENLYKIIRVAEGASIYSDSNLSNRITIEDFNGAQSKYILNTHKATVGANLIVTEDNSNNYRVQVPTPVNKSSSSTCEYTYAKKGSYPNYEQLRSQSVNINDAAFACDYGNFSNQEMYVSKSNTSVISNNNVVSPGDYESGNTGSGGNYVIEPNLSICPNLVSQTESNGVYKYNYKSNNGLTNCNYTYDGNKSTETILYNDSNNKKIKDEYSEYDSFGNYTYKRIRSFANTKIINRVDYFYTNGKVETETFQEFESNGNVSYKRVKYFKSGNTMNTSRTDYFYTNGKVNTETFQEFESNGKVSYKRVKYFENGNTMNTSRTDYFYTNGKVNTETFQEFESNGKVSYKRVKYFKNGNTINSSRIDYFYENGQLKTETHQEFDSKGNVISKTVKHY